MTARSLRHELGVVHRDIKPANIFIAREGDLDVTKVLDFGIAKLIDHKLEAPADITEAAARELALSRPTIQKWIEGRPVRKVIFAGGKVVNIVVG